MKVGLCEHHALFASVYLPLYPFLIKLGMYGTRHEPILTAYFINRSHQSVCLYVYPQPLICNGSVKTHANIGELLEAPFSIRSV
jgi:hypothetical protein